MLILVRLVSVSMSVFGIVLVLSPEIFKKVIAYFKEGNRIYRAGVIRILLGCILLIASPQCRWTVFTIVIGIFFVLAGCLIFILGLKKSKSILNMWEKKLGVMMPLTGLIPITLGIFLLFAA